MMRFLPLLFVAFFTSPAHAQSSFENIGRYFAEETESGRLSGAVLTITGTDATLYQKAFGLRVPGSDEAMGEDALFRLYSMTKPITTVAVLQLMEEGKFRLSDPISTYLPEFSAQDNVPTIWDLLRHTSGLTYGQGGPEVTAAYKEKDLLLSVWVKGDPQKSLTNEDVSQRLAASPLAFKPGEKWAYGRSTDVLGRLVEVISEQSLEDYLQAHILGPLDMRDTTFHPQSRANLAEPPINPKTGKPHNLFTEDRTFEAGGEGLYGTSDDYAAFCRMLLNEGGDILSSKSIAMMTTDQLGPLAHKPDFNLGPSYSFGFNVFVRTALGPSPIPGSKGEFGWWGSGGTAFWVDPEAEFCAIMMTQQPDESRHYSRAFRALVYGSME